MKSATHRLVAFAAALSIAAAALGQEPKPRLVIKGDNQNIEGVAFSESGAILATRNSAGVVTLWNVTTGKPINSIKNHPSGTSLALSPDGKFVYTGGQEIKVWDAKSGKEVRSFKHDQAVVRLALSPDGKLLASGHSRPADVVMWDTASGKQLRVHKGTDQFSRVHELSFSTDSRLLAMASSNSKDNVVVWDTIEGKEIAKFTPSGLVATLAFSPDGKLLATPTGSFGGKAPIKLWDTTNWKEVAALEGHKVSVYALAFSRDGSTLYSRDENNVMKVWDMAGKAEKASFSVRWPAVVVSTDGKTLAVGGAPKGGGAPAELFLFNLPLP